MSPVRVYEKSRKLAEIWTYSPIMNYELQNSWEGTIPIMEGIETKVQKFENEEFENSGLTW